MATIDVEALLAPISDDAPCGQDIEAEQGFIALEVAAKGKAERESKGKKIPAEEPKWLDVADKAVDLLGESKNLQIAVHLTRAATHLDGLSGAADGLTLIAKLLESYWDDVYPLLDEEDDNDPTIRLNSLLPLNNAAFLIKDLESAPIVQVRTFGAFSMRSIRLANGDVSPKDDEEKPDSTHIEAAFKGAELDDLVAENETVDRALEAVSGIETSLNEAVDATFVPAFDKLTAELKAIKGTLADNLSARGVAVEGVDVDSPEGNKETVSGDIRSRQDAIQSMDRISEYFRQNEPSSPVPLLMERAKRLVAKDFMEIIQDLAPDGVRQAKLVGGLDDDN